MSSLWVEGRTREVRDDAAAARPIVRRPRDSRVDLLRGLALVSVLVDHMPGNSLSTVTIQSFGFCDAAEIFVFLAGYSATMAYGRVFERDGLMALWRKIGWRCLTLYTTHLGLFFATLSILAVHAGFAGTGAAFLAPFFDEGVGGLARAVSLAALPTYLDILPLYVVLLACFPAVLFLLRRGALPTLAVSMTVYALANLLQINLPNYIDRSTQIYWTFNPLTWQLIYVLGAVVYWESHRGNDLFMTRRSWLRLACYIYLGFAFVVVRYAPVWFGTDMDDIWPALIGNEAKVFSAPWRVLNILALCHLLMTSLTFATAAKSELLNPITASGRHSLKVFGLICILSLLGRITFRDVGYGAGVQFVVNLVSVTLMLWMSCALDRRRARSKPGDARTLVSLERAG